MKKIFIIATAAFLICGVSFAQDKKGVKEKSSCKKGSGCCSDKAKAAKKDKSTVKI